jgi:thiol-disulfide isomerase/thioredoxin
MIIDNILFTKKAILNTFMLMTHCRHEKHSAKCVLSALLLFVFLFTITGTVSAQELSLISFGKGQIQVRLYADYFCGPCRILEPRIEYLVSDLVKRNVITITFIDAPFHKYSSLYAKYFLYILNEKKDINRAIKARNTLFEASNDSLFEQTNLEAFLQEKGLKFKAFDVKATGDILQNYLREDQIVSTPTCVILKGKKKEVSVGPDDIVKALEQLK